LMGGKGRLIATDRDKRQLAPIFERLSRAGVHNAEVRAPKGEDDPLADIRSSADLVLIDAPCTGTGTAPAPGAATPTPNGACAPARSKSA
jgi:16S rRNA (cytosine967-C5)-methyltransferase